MERRFKRSFTRNNKGLAGVIEALLLVALVAMIMSTIQLFYIPEIMEQKESDHMDVVTNQFSYLKSVIEIQAMMGLSQSDQPIAYSPISSPLTLGSDKLPYFVTSWSWGTINIIDEDSASDSYIYISPEPSEVLKWYVDGEIPLTSFAYNSDNAYFVDQKYVLEGGLLLLNQSAGEVTKIEPAITVENTSSDFTINYVLPILEEKAGKLSDAGIDTVFIRTNYSSHIVSNENVNVSFFIYTDYVDAWYNALSYERDGLFTEYIEDNKISVSKSYASGYVKIASITPKPLHIDITLVKLQSQIGPGVVR